MGLGFVGGRQVGDDDAAAVLAGFGNTVGKQETCAGSEIIEIIESLAK